MVPAPVGRTTLLLPFLLLAALIATDLVLVLRAQPAARAAQTRSAVLDVATREARNLTTLDYRSARRDLDRIVALATGDLRDRFTAQRGRLPGLLAREQSTSRGTVRAAGVVRLSDTSAEVVVAVDAQVRTGAGVPQVRHSRLLMRLRDVAGRWLVESATLVGAGS